MAQNIYDDHAFFEAYARLPRSQGGLDQAPEWPSLRALLPPLAGKRVLDVGCGYGWSCRWARESGTSSVVGVDLSERMLARASELTDDLSITYRIADLESLRLDEDGFDLVDSSLAFHYVEDFAGLARRIAGWLVPGGRLVFSVEHPIYTAPSNPGWIETGGGGAAWPLDRYLDEGPRRTNWLAEGVVKQHRTVATYVSALLHAGLALRGLVEWGPDSQQIAAHPDWAHERARPPFLLVAADRP